MNILRRAKERFDTLIVGVHNDAQVMSYKNRRPTIPYEYRLEMIKGCKYVDQVIENADPVVTDSYLDSLGADYVVAGRERIEHLARCYPVSESRLHLITRTEGISSSQIRGWCAQESQ
jgi:cytidyltransferase-like protein